MKKILLAVTIFMASGSVTYGQKTYLDTEKYASCELFAQKSGYDWQQRLLQMDSLDNQEVTVFELKGRDNQIKTSYTGTVKNPWKAGSKPPSKGQATVVSVIVNADGQKRAYFPLTNDKRYRIYLKSCLH